MEEREPKYTVTELIGDYSIENQVNFDFIGPLDDAITLARTTFDASPDKDKYLYYIVVMELLEDTFVEYLIHKTGEYRGDDATQMSEKLAALDLKDA
jgi:hypothetical protein